MELCQLVDHAMINDHGKSVHTEEDCNPHATALFMSDAWYWAAVDEQPKLNAKSDLVVEICDKAHSSLDSAISQKLRADKLLLDAVFSRKLAAFVFCHSSASGKVGFRLHETPSQPYFANNASFCY
ncbi:MAG: hypothetical protein IPK32_23620 [Verrucomicrobiaceae bacterium]|nr:hypothetical protein [Verrucomicrobiaceae bacterium]